MGKEQAIEQKGNLLKEIHKIADEYYSEQDLYKQFPVKKHDKVIPFTDWKPEDNLLSQDIDGEV